MPRDSALRLIPRSRKRGRGAGLPKIYAPRSRPDEVGGTRFTATLSAALPWTVTVTDATRRGARPRRRERHGRRLDVAARPCPSPRRTRGGSSRRARRPRRATLGGRRRRPCSRSAGARPSPATITPERRRAGRHGDDLVHARRERERRGHRARRERLRRSPSLSRSSGAGRRADSRLRRGRPPGRAYIVRVARERDRRPRGRVEVPVASRERSAASRSPPRRCRRTATVAPTALAAVPLRAPARSRSRMLGTAAGSRRRSRLARVGLAGRQLGRRQARRAAARRLVRGRRRGDRRGGHGDRSRCRSAHATRAASCAIVSAKPPPHLGLRARAARVRVNGTRAACTASGAGAIRVPWPSGCGRRRRRPGRGRERERPFRR